MKAKFINEDFERGMGARRALEVGGLNFQEGFSEDFKNILDKWFSLLKTLEGKTISAVSVQHFTGKNPSEKITHKIKVQRVLEPGIRPAHIMDKNEESIILSQWVVGEDGSRYELDLRKKIYIDNES
jgi:hypothetical protein